MPHACSITTLMRDYTTITTIHLTNIRKRPPILGFLFFTVIAPWAAIGSPQEIASTEDTLSASHINCTATCSVSCLAAGVRFGTAGCCASSPSPSPSILPSTSLYAFAFQLYKLQCILPRSLPIFIAAHLGITSAKDLDGF